jgi:hypothetical protein
MLRQFVEQEGLDVRASSKRALYTKICDIFSSKAACAEDVPVAPKTQENHAQGHESAQDDGEDSTLDKLLAETASFRATIKERHEVLRASAQLWRSGDVCGTVREASLSGDASVLSSLLDCSPSQLVDLEVFATLLQPAALPRLMHSQEEHHQVGFITSCCQIG